MKKKLIRNLLLVLTMVVLCFAVMMTASAETEGYYTYEVVDGNAIITDVDTAISGDIVIPDTLGGYPVTEIGDSAFVECKNITSVIMPDTIETIGLGAFSSCFELKDVKLSENLKNISEFAFNFDYNLTGIIIPDSVTSIEYLSFGFCSNLKYVTIGNGVEYIGVSAFEHCYNLADITFGNNVKCIDEMAFYWCSSIKNITIPETVTEIGDWAFEGLRFLEKMIIMNPDTVLGECFACVNENIDVTNITSEEFADLLLSILLGDDEAAAELDKLYIGGMISNGTISAHPGSTTEAYAAANGVVFEPIHFYNEWTYDYDNMIRYRECKIENCDAREEESLETTGSGDVEIIEPVDPDTDFVVDVLTDYVIIEEALTEGVAGDWEIVKAFDITMTGKDGVHVQPDGTVKVKLPLDWSKDGVYKVYRVNEDGTLTDMEAYRQGSHMVFDTDHFSIYVIVDESEKTDEPITPDTPDNTEVCSKCGRSAHDDSFVQRLICIIIMAKRLIISLFKK